MIPPLVRISSRDRSVHGAMTLIPMILAFLSKSAIALAALRSATYHSIGTPFAPLTCRIAWSTSASFPRHQVRNLPIQRPWRRRDRGRCPRTTVAAWPGPGSLPHQREPTPRQHPPAAPARRKNGPATLPRPATVARSAYGGTVITMAPEPPDLSKAADARRARALLQRLRTDDA